MFGSEQQTKALIEALHAQDHPPCMRCAPRKRTELLMHQIHAACGLSERCVYMRSICMYHMHDSFGKRTELLMHDLAGAATGALQMSSGILDALDGMDAKMAGKTRLYN